MSRCIRFRGWDEYSRRMMQPGEFDLYQEIDNGFHAGYSRPGGDWVLLDLMQFTGIHDKNGNAIYEGDVVIDSQSRGKSWVIEYRTDSEYVGFVPVEIGKESHRISRFVSWGNMVVVGNIYQDSHLLTIHK